MTDLAGRRLVHLTTTDISLALLLGPQLRAFADAGMEVIGASAPGPWTSDLGPLGITHEPLAHATRAFSLGQDALALAELVRLFRRLRPDIVHTHNPKPGFYGRLAARLAGVPIVVNTVHGIFATSADSRSRRLLVYGLERLASTCSQAELVQNVEDVQTLRNLKVPAEKLLLLGNGIDLTRFRPRPGSFAGEARRALGVSPDQVAVGFVGRLVREKGLRELFEAARQLRAQCPELVFVIVGPMDPDKADGVTETELAAAKAEGNVLLVGERREVESVYPAFDLFALPSYREGFPRAAMEASACAVPVVATDVRGCRQVVTDGVSGLLVPARDAGALAAALTTLARDPERRQRMAAAARAKAERDFDEEHVIALVLETYRRLLGTEAIPSPTKTDGP